jgi:uncharacterized phosphosugar-binding protein
MIPTEQYLRHISELLEKIAGERANIQRAAVALADQIAQDRLIHVFGSGGHSLMGAEEVTYRAGGLVPMNPIFEPSVSVQQGALRSMLLERVPGLMTAVLKLYRLQPGEVIIIVTAYGVNAATIDTALEAKRLGLTVIGVTSAHTANLLPPEHPSRHPSGKNLHEIADIWVNTHVPAGDAVVEIPGFAQRVSAVSTICNAFALECIVAETVNELVRRGIPPPVWMSANVPGGDAANKRYIEKYVGRVRYL